MDPGLSIYCLGLFIGFLGINTGVFDSIADRFSGMNNSYYFFPVRIYLDISAILAGADVNLAYYLISIINAGAGVGRLWSSYIANKIGTSYSRASDERLDNSN
jgi:hypothetical protein